MLIKESEKKKQGMWQSIETIMHCNHISFFSKHTLSKGGIPQTFLISVHWESFLERKLSIELLPFYILTCLFAIFTLPFFLHSSRWHGTHISRRPISGPVKTALSILKADAFTQMETAFLPLFLLSPQIFIKLCLSTINIIIIPTPPSFSSTRLRSTDKDAHFNYVFSSKTSKSPYYALLLKCILLKWKQQKWKPCVVKADGCIPFCLSHYFPFFSAQQPTKRAYDLTTILGR